MGRVSQLELLTLGEHLGSPPVFGGVRVAHRVRFFMLCFVFCFVCLHLESCVPKLYHTMLYRVHL
jgi:hypothetical protein